MITKEEIAKEIIQEISDPEMQELLSETWCMVHKGGATVPEFDEVIQLLYNFSCKKEDYKVADNIHRFTACLITSGLKELAKLAWVKEHL